MLILKQPWHTQPQCAVVPRLPFKALFLPSTNYNIAGGRVTVGPLVNTVIKAERNGFCYYKNGSGAANVEMLKGAELPAQGCTVLYAGYALSGDFDGHFGEGSGTPGKRLGAHVPWGGDGNVYWDFGGTSTGTTRLAIAAGTLSDSDIWVFTTGDRGMEIWKNGLLFASNSANPTRTVADGANDHWGLAPHSWAATSGAQRCYALGLLSYQVSPAIASALSRSHASMYETALEPQNVYIPVSIIGGGAYSLNLETGIYSFTGSSATLSKNSKLTLDSGTYALSGSNASLLKGLILEAASGTYSLTGSDASLFYTHLLNASSGSYAITGSDATLTYTPTAGAYTLNAESGAYVLLGQDVTFVYSGSEVTLKAGSWIRYRIIT